MPGTRYPRKMINGVPVVAAPAEVDITNAEELRRVLLDASGRGHPTVVLDMTRTRFCDSAGMNTMLSAHRRAQAQGGELRIVVPACGPVPRAFALICLDRVIPCFTSFGEALAATPAAANPAQVIALSAYRRRRQR
jgi:anti-anti-sigma factor